MTVHVRALAVAQADEVAVGDGRTVTVRVVSWNTEHRVTDDGVTYYRERFLPGGLNARPGREVLARAEHDPAMFGPGVDTRPGYTAQPGTPVGRVVATHVRSDGLYADIRVFGTRDGDDLLELVNEGIITSISAEFDDTARRPQPGELVDRVDAELVGIAFTLHPQHADAAVLAVRSQPNPTTEETTEMEPDEITGDDIVGTDTPDNAGDDMSVEPEPVLARSQPAAPRTAPRPGATAGAQRRVGHFRSFGEFAQAVALGRLGGLNDERRQRFARALAAADTSDASGLLPDQWIPEVIDLYRTLTPSVQAFRQRTLPDTGMVLNQPIVTTRPTVNAQASQQTEVASQAGVIGTATWNVATYGGGMNASLQVIERTEPGYLDEMFRLWVREMALDINGDVATALVAQADNGVSGTNAPLEYTTAAAFDDLVIDASAVFLDTMHRPAEVVLLSVDLWKDLAKATGSDGHPLYPTVNPMNRQGSMNAVDTSGNIVGVTWYVEPALGGVGDGIQAIIGVRDAWMTATGPIGTLAADVPTSLSRDNAVYQFAAFGATDSAGLVLVENLV